jgi:hypothetical protein
MKRLSRPVTFRVFTDEYEAFTDACVRSGARSMSDFARKAVLQQVQYLDTTESTLSGDLLTLSRELKRLDQALEDTRRRIREVLGLAAG